jgi:hypothetical protein
MLLGSWRGNSRRGSVANLEADGRNLSVRNLERDGACHAEGDAHGQDKDDEEDERAGLRQCFD